MEISNFISGALSATFLLGVAAFLSKTWLEKRIELSIAHEYEKKMLSLEHENELRMKAALVADLLSFWITQVPITDPARLNQLTFEAFLWLPEPIARDLSNTLARQPGADSVKTILTKVRKHLLGADDKLTAQEIISFNGQAAAPASAPTPTPTPVP